MALDLSNKLLDADITCLDTSRTSAGGDTSRSTKEKKRFFKAELDRLKDAAKTERDRPVYKEPEKYGFFLFKLFFLLRNSIPVLWNCLKSLISKQLTSGFGVKN